MLNLQHIHIIGSYIVLNFWHFGVINPLIVLLCVPVCVVFVTVIVVAVLNTFARSHVFTMVHVHVCMDHMKCHGL